LPARAADALEEVTKRPRPTATVAAAIKLSRRRTLELLKALEAAGLATPTRGQVPRGRPATLWTRSPMTLDEAAARLGVAGASRNRRKKLKTQHSEERARFDEALQGSQPHMPLTR
jgi:predicted ArsR family transcriptional regulator